ncbi:MAG TPA: sulfotransferase [Candidatus Kryptonia bacterium]|nr:sulfotransferase [Candidatus Kryptonia bacterium]
MGRTEDIRIADLADPVLTPAQDAAIGAARAMPMSLTEDAVLTAARQKTGLSDFGAEDFRERLRVWLAAADEDTELSPLGRLTVFGNCVRVLANRLRLEELLKHHPEILDVEIHRPIIIAGLPRSGTTHLVNLISADTRLRSLPYWESLEPFPAPDDIPGPDGVDPRLIRCRQIYERSDRLLPLLRAMHHMTPEHVHEEIEVQELDFSTYNLEWYARVPRWRDFYLSYDQRPHYRYLKKALQALQWLRGPDRWILKSPQHLEQLVPLTETFPDATIVLTHRDPVHVIQSAITMLAYGARIRRTRVDPRDIAAYWIDRIERLLRACVRDRDRVPASHSLDVLFHEFMADDVAMVERIYALADLPMTGAARARLDAFMKDNPRGKHGRVAYDLRTDFGVEPAELRKRFDFYRERFPVQVEDE